MIRRQSFFGYTVAIHAVHEGTLDASQGGRKDEGIFMVRPRGQIDDQDLLELSKWLIYINLSQAARSTPRVLLYMSLTSPVDVLGLDGGSAQP